MNANIITDVSFPHGTPQGYPRGCHGSHCPAAISCLTVAKRYSGDWAFRKLIDAGMTVKQIADQEQKQAQEAAQEAKRAARVLGKHTRNRQYVRRIPGQANTPNQKAIKELWAEGLTDGEIAKRLGKTRDQVCSSRHFMKLPTNRKAPATTGAVS